MRACIYCGCTEDRACQVEGLLGPEGCSWISLSPAVCSAEACVRQHTTARTPAKRSDRKRGRSAKIEARGRRQRRSR